MDIKSKKQNLARRKKRKWNGIKPSEHRRNKQQQQQPQQAFPEISCASSRKLDTSVSTESYDIGDYFIPINYLLLKDFCLVGKLIINDLFASRMGLCHLLE